jgi:hypothetical protein
MVIAPRSIRSNSEYSMSIATHYATQPVQFRVKVYERKVQSLPLDFAPNPKDTVEDPFDSQCTMGPTMDVVMLRSMDSFSNDTTAPVSGVKTKTVTVDPNVPKIVKINVRIMDFC